MRALPFIIGTQSFMEAPDAGLGGFFFEEQVSEADARQSGLPSATKGAQNVRESGEFVSGNDGGFDDDGYDDQPSYDDEDDNNFDNEAEPDTAQIADPRFEKFSKMLNMGLPEGAVRQKMTAEGYTSSEIESFLNPGSAKQQSTGRSSTARPPISLPPTKQTNSSGGGGWDDDEEEDERSVRKSVGRPSGRAAVPQSYDDEDNQDGGDWNDEDDQPVAGSVKHAIPSNYDDEDDESSHPAPSGMSLKASLEAQLKGRGGGLPVNKKSAPPAQSWGDDDNDDASIHRASTVQKTNKALTPSREQDEPEPDEDDEERDLFGVADDDPYALFGSGNKTNRKVCVYY